MKTKFALIVAFLIGMGVAPAHAQLLTPQEVVITAHRDYNSASFEYCSMNGQAIGVGVGNSSTTKNKIGRVRISATANSTTVNGVGAFNNIAVGDELIVSVAGVMEYRTVATRASADQITIDTVFLPTTLAVTNAEFEYRTSTCGATDSSGAIGVDGFSKMNFQVQVDAISATSLDYELECRMRGPASGWTIVVGPTNKTSTGRFMIPTTADEAARLNTGWGECRVGLKMNTDTAGAEDITILMTALK